VLFDIFDALKGYAGGCWGLFSTDWTGAYRCP
jgi:hypothetical protein